MHSANKQRRHVMAVITQRIRIGVHLFSIVLRRLSHMTHATKRSLAHSSATTDKIIADFAL